MVRTSKLLVGLAVVVLSGGLVVAYTGVAAPTVSPAELPGSPLAGFVAAMAIVFAGFGLSSYLDRRAWKHVGQTVGLQSAGSLNPLTEPDMTGTVDGYPVRVRTYSTGGGSEGSNRTYTVVEATLRNAVEWSGMVGVRDGWDAAEMPDLGSTQAVTVDGFVVWGDVSDAVAEDLLTQRVRNALTEVGRPVAIGETEQLVVGAMLEELPDEAESMGQTFAEGMLNLADDGDDGPTTHAEVRDQGVCLDERELERRIDAATTVADAVDRIGARPG